MTDKKKLLETRKEVKDRKPEFLAQNSRQKVRVAKSWRRPRGLQSKMRHKFKGYPIMVSKGWRSPVEVRGLNNKGYETVLVYNVADLDNVKKDQAIIIAGTVGNKKRLAIVEKAESLKLVVANIKTDKFKAKIAKQKSDKDAEKAQKTEKKKKTIEDSLKKAEKKEKDKKKSAESPVESTPEEDEQAADDAKAEEKKKKDDILIHKE